MTTGRVLRPEMADLKTQHTTQHFVPPTVQTLEDAERAHITATLRETRWVVGGRNGAAARLGLPRTTLIAMMRRLGISSDAPQSLEHVDLARGAAAGGMGSPAGYGKHDFAGAR